LQSANDHRGRCHGRSLLQWHLLHGEGLTRHRRAYFDIVNVLETYQTRARTHGHLFQPDPPTPLVTFLPDGTAVGGVHEAPAEKTDFMMKRDEHYANMFQYAMQMNKELDMMMGKVSSLILQYCNRPMGPVQHRSVENWG
ncbi:hypothetical protein COOONC_04313, partial [Cooperia oncophora]